MRIALFLCGICAINVRNYTSIANFKMTPTITNKKMYLFCDTEITGLPLDWKAPIGQLDNWPIIVEIGWILTDKNGNEIENNSIIFKPDGFRIPADTSAIRGISNEIANEKGLDRVDVLKTFAELLNKASAFVGRNTKCGLRSNTNYLSTSSRVSHL